jgi:hypothetical protein
MAKLAGRMVFIQPKQISESIVAVDRVKKIGEIL